MLISSKSLSMVCMLAVVTVVAQAQIPAAAGSSNELVNLLTSRLHISPQQAQGGAGAIFGLVKSRVSPAEFTKLEKFVPGMDGFLNAAPQAGGANQGAVAQPGAAANAQASPASAQNATGALQGEAQSAMGSLGSAQGGAGGLASLAGSFESLGLSPTMVSKFAPIMQNYLGTKGGPGVASIFSGALK